MRLYIRPLLYLKDVSVREIQYLTANLIATRMDLRHSTSPFGLCSREGSVTRVSTYFDPCVAASAAAFSSARAPARMPSME